jgi:hypothetical protein
MHAPNKAGFLRVGDKFEGESGNPDRITNDLKR